jgi:isoleucyl-tRNA synthetase
LHVLATALTLGSEKTSGAFKNVMCTGLIMAEDGEKMSKRLKNYPEPGEVLEQYGADALRLYLMSSPAVKAETLNFAEKDVANLRRRVFVIWWNVLAFYKTFAKSKLVFQFRDRYQAKSFT